MNIRYIIYISLSVFFLSSCSSSGRPDDLPKEQALVSVNGKTLYWEDIEDIIPQNLTPEDSILAAEAYIKMWIKNELVYEKAVENLSDKEQIEALVENYRRSLTVFTYQEQLLKERLSKKISDKDLETYYNENTQQFDLNTDIVKGLFLKVPLTSPRLDDLKKWYRQGNEVAVENIEKYSLENAVNYDYFYDKWVDFTDIMNNIPIVIPNSQQFLVSNKNLEVQDSSYVYLLHIKEYVLSGKTAPFEYSKGEIMDILMNQRKEDFIKQFENDLYNTAVNNNKIKYYNKP